MALDLIVRNACIAGMPPGVPPADIAIEGGRIVAIDHRLAADGGEVIDAGGRMVSPGLIETHIHLD